MGIYPFDTTYKKLWLRLVSAEFILTLLVLAALLVFGLAAKMVFINKTTVIDEKTFQFIAPHISPLRTKVFLMISFLGKHSFLIPVNLLLLAFFAWQKKQWISVRVAALSLSSLGVMFLLKLSFHRLRPPAPLIEKVSGFSFPSGHAFMSVVFYGLLIYITWFELKKQWPRWLIIILLAMIILLIGFSRVYLRLHYTSDVIAGFAIGFAWLVLSLWLISKFEKRSLQKK